MATTTPNLGLPRPEGSDYVTRANYVELIDTIDEKVASVSELDAHVNDKNNPHGVTPEQIGAETPAGAQAKASAAEQAAKEYTDQKIAAIPEPPVTSVNNKTGAVVLTKSDIGLGSVDNVRQATKSEFDAHVANTNNPHGVTKAQVGLGNVQNYGIATQAEARAGTSNSKYMTPLRTKEAITALTGGVPLRVNNGMLEYNDGSGWKPVGGSGVLVASDTVQHEFLTERSAEQGGSGYILVAKFVPRYTGEILFECEGKTSSTYFTLRIAPHISNNIGTEDMGPDYRTPVGTVMEYSPTKNERLIDKPGSLQYRKYSTKVLVFSKTPYYIYMTNGSNNSVRNIRIKYDVWWGD